MRTYYSSRLAREVSHISPGEWFCGDSNVVINTTLGSCVAVVLHDPVKNVGGMNHFMLARGEARGEELPGRYGCYAMIALLQDLESKGCKRENLRAKIFGGAEMISVSSSANKTGYSGPSVGMRNIAFARDFLEEKHIFCVSEDVGGKDARRIYYSPGNFKILVKKISVCSSSLSGK